MRDTLYQAIEEALQELGATDVAFVVERPSDFSHGDYATNAALVAAKQLGKSPRDVAALLQQKLLEEKSLARQDALQSGRETRGPFRREVFAEAVHSIEIAGPGFINFFLTKEAITAEVSLAAQNEFISIESDVLGKVVMVEYTDPNPFKEFHIGHLMSNTIGESIARILETSGAQVVRVNYQGDVGPHVAKAMYVLLEEGIISPTIADISRAYVQGATLYEDDITAKVSIDNLNKLIYEQLDGVTDERVWSLYSTGKKISLEHFEELYRKLGTTFQYYFFESKTASIGKRLVLSNQTVFVDSGSAKIYPGEKLGLHTRVFLTSSPYNLPTYEAKDLGLLELKKDTAPFDLSITVTASEQNDYFKVVLAAAREVPEVAEVANKTVHVSHGMMRLAEGKMSSRKGNVVTGESLLLDLEVAAKEKMQGRNLIDAQKIAEQVAVGAIKYAVLKQGSNKDIVFDPEQSLSLEGDSGPYLQYAHTRANSLIKKALAAGIVVQATASVADVETFTVERLLLHFQNAVARSAAELEPHYITTYLTELASEFNAWYASQRVIDSAHPEHMLGIVFAVKNTLAKGLQLLGIPAPEEM